MRKRTLSILTAAACAFAAVFSACSSGAEGQSTDPYTYFGVSDESSAALVTDGAIAEEQARVDDGEIYIPWTYVWNEIDPAFWLEEDTGSLVLTGESGGLTWTEGRELMFDGDEAFVSASLLKQYSSAEIGIFEDPARVIIRTPGRTIRTAETLEETEVCIRRGKGALTELSGGETVEVLSEEDGCIQVLTGDGYTGFVDNKKLSGTAEVITGNTENDFGCFRKRTLPETARMIWDYIEFTGDNDYLEAMLAKSEGVNIIAPTWYALTGTEGEITSLSGREYVDKAHEMGMRVWPLLSDLALDPDTVGKALARAETREKMIAFLMAEADALGFDGINVDLEHISERYAPAFIQFLRELTAEAHVRELMISVSNYVPQYTRYYNRAAQIEACDYIVVMAYDEHTGSSSEIGSAASLPFVVQGVEDTLEEVPAENVILGVPFYSRAWIQNFGEEGFSSQALDMEGARNFIRQHGIDTALYWDQTAGQYCGTATDDTARYSIWQEEETSLAEKLSLVRNYGLAGAAGWRLGYEEDSVWTVWTEKLE